MIAAAPVTEGGPPEGARVYEPRGAARELWRCKDPEILLEGPAGTGKTTAILEKVFALSMKYAGSRHLLCRKTRASMTQSVLVTFEEKVLPEGSPLKDGPNRQQRQSYRLPNGSEIVVGGLDKPERTFSTEYDTISVFEAVETTENEWESLHRALRNGRMRGYHQAIADTNPGPRSHWLNVRANAGRMTRLLSRHEDNPEYFDGRTWTPRGAEYIARLDRLTGHRFLRLRRGLWASAEGVVYPGFDAARHVIEPFKVPADWRRIRSIDFGYTNPFCCQWWAIDGDGRLFLYREIYTSGVLVQDHADKIKRLSEGENIEATVCDHDAEDRATLARYGVRTLMARKAVRPGIEAVSARLGLAGDGRPRIYLMRGACVEEDAALAEAKKPTCTEQEFDGYVYAKGQDGKPNKEEPAKVDDHGLDSLRYAVAHIDLKPRPVMFGFAPVASN